VVNQFQGESSNYIWNDIYPTFEDAISTVKAIGGDLNGLSSEFWLQRITKQITDYRNEFNQYGIAMPPRPSNLPLVCAITRPISIVDFGGSSGWCWDYLKNTSLYSSSRLSSYVVVETEDVVNYMKKSGIHESPVNYITLKDSVDNCELLYCNSVLQYFESNAPLFYLIERTKPQYIFLEDLVVNGEDDFFSIQSFRGSVIPYRFLGLHKLINELACLGYEELVKYPYASPVLGIIKPLEMGNFPEAKRLRYSQSILLKNLR
jgi:putative methyltransferase (TIGR04325 family)